MTVRRELALAVGLCLVGSVLVLLAVSRSWLVTSSDALTIRDLDSTLDGARVSASTQALGVVGLVGVLALAATRSWGRVLVGLLVTLAGLGIVVGVAQVLREQPRDLVPSDCGRSLGCPVPERGSAVERSTTWPVTALSGGILLVAGGALVTLRGRGWSGLSSAYDAPVAAPPSGPPTDRATWDALDRGQDPTA